MSMESTSSQSSTVPEWTPADSDGAQITPAERATVAPEQPRRRASWRWIVGAVVLLLLLWLGYKALRIGLYGRSAYQHAMTMAQLADNGLDLSTLDQVAQPLNGAATALESLEREARPFAPILNRLGWLPTYGPTVAAAPELLVAGAQLSALAQDGLSFVQSAAPTDPPTDAAAWIGPLLTALPAADGEMNAMAARAAAASEALATVPAAELDARLAGPMALAQQVLPVLPPFMRMAPAAPDLLGMDGPRTYLLLVQNNHELRATGGFITALGRVTLENGALVDLEFADSSRVMRNDVEYPWAPDPLRRYMGIELMVLRDANWSPDFPTTAQTVRSLYAQETGVYVDGIITVDLHAVEQIVAGLGELTLPDFEEPLNSANIVDQIKQFWTQPLETGDTIESAGLGRWWSQRKNFMPALAAAALERVQSGEVDYPRMAIAVLAALDQRAIQVWLHHKEAQQQLAALHWDGGLHPEPGADFIAWVDSNLGYNKVDAVIQRDLDYHVTWPAGAAESGLAELTMTYRHPTPVEGHRCDLTPRYGTSYDDMTLRCYFNYVRVYVPAGSELISAEGVDPDSVSSQRGERGAQMFSGYFVLLPGEETTVTFTYRLPAELKPSDYRLVVQRQSGVGPVPFRASIDGDKAETRLEDGWLRLE